MLCFTKVFSAKDQQGSETVVLRSILTTQGSQWTLFGGGGGRRGLNCDNWATMYQGCHTPIKAKFPVFSLWFSYVYHLQRSCGKVMFLHLSVILLSARWDTPPPRPVHTCFNIFWNNYPWWLSTSGQEIHPETHSLQTRTTNSQKKLQGQK